MYCWKYNSDSGCNDIVLFSSGKYLEGLSFTTDETDLSQHEEKLLPVFSLTVKWLDIYFSGRQPDFNVDISIECTEFQRRVYDILLTIPFGQYRTYGDIADQIAEERGIRKMSAQAVGQAVGANPVAIIIPCHRVLGSGRKLTGYSGGINNKIILLNRENIDFKR